MLEKRKIEKGIWVDKKIFYK